MNGATDEARTCQVCGRGEEADLRPAVLVRPAVAALVRAGGGGWSERGWICRDDLRDLRHRHVEQLLAEERGELTDLEREVLASLREQEILARNPDQAFDRALTLGERMADRIAGFGGSWRFILSFGAVLGAWILLNAVVLARKPFDPYPFILLNLVLSCLAALQAPVIMMSQNRQEARDRARALHDYQVNLKAELEIRHLHQKMDHLLTHQWERLVEIQEVQLDLMEELRGRR
jgi:uncharacterized membrane protein